MTEPYTPTTDEVRKAWGRERFLVGPGVAETEFDRWLALHDAEVRAAALWETLRPEMTGEWGVAFDLTNSTAYEAYLSETDARTIASRDPSGRTLVHRFVTDWEEAE